MKFLVAIIFSSLSFSFYPQVGIGTDDPQAQLDIIAHTPDSPDVKDGILIPRISRFPANKPGVEQHGMMIFLTIEQQEKPTGFYFWNATHSQWRSIGATGPGNFYNPGTTTNAGNILDPMYRAGSVGIGTQVITSKLQIALNSTEDAAIKKGLEVDNNNPTTDNLTTYGIISDNRSATNGTKYGFKNNVGGLGLGVHYGIFNEAYQNTGTNDIYGVFNRVGRTFGARSNNFGIYSQIGTLQGVGNIYGIYSIALGDPNSNVFAGYFAGRLGIGATPQEEYIFPATRGKTDQILILDSSGNLNWKYSSTQNYSSTGSTTGPYIVSDEIYSLRINDQVSGLTIPPANLNKGRIIVLIAWKGTKTKPFTFTGSDDIYDMINDSSVASIIGGEIMTIQSAGNRWILLDIRKAP